MNTEHTQNAIKKKQKEKPFDVICLGRIAVDLYGQQIGSKLEDMTTFNKYLGGSSGNVAYGTAVQGLKSSMLARVGNEQMGQFLREELQRVGCDTSHLITDHQRLTALVILGIKDQETFPLIFYRDNCADMALSKEDINEAYIASAKCLAITGTHLSHPNTREAVITALQYARSHDIKTVLDIDYRPVLWGLTSLGDGETRFIESDYVTSQLQEVLHFFDVIVGTEEEFHIAGGDTDTRTALANVRQATKAELVCKRGTLGCSVFSREIPATIDGGLNISGFNVEVLNVLGAGDAFLSGLLRGYLNNEGWEQACTYANACGALVVSRHGCSPAMPTKDELDYFLEHASSIKYPHQDQPLNHLHRVTTRKIVTNTVKSRKSSEDQDLYILAFDHRVQIEELALEANADFGQIPRLKQLILEALFSITQEAKLQGQTGILCDSKYGQSVLNRITGKPVSEPSGSLTHINKSHHDQFNGNQSPHNQAGYWIGRPIELPSSRPLVLEHGDIGTQLIEWPQSHIVKCLVYYHPFDDEAIRLKQELLLIEIYQACLKSGHQLLLEVILPKENNLAQKQSLYVLALERLYNLGIKPDWWKLPPLNHAIWRSLSDLIKNRDPYCEGILILGLDAPTESLKLSFNASRGIDKIRGFAIGRTVFAAPARLWLANQIDDQIFVAQIESNYLALIDIWREARS